MRAGSESEGGPSGGDSSSGDEDGDKGKDLLQKLFGDGGELYRTTRHGVGDDCEIKGPVLRHQWGCRGQSTKFGA